MACVRLFLIPLTMGFLALSEPGHLDPAPTRRGTSNSNPLVSPSRFRDIFFALLDSKYTDEEKKQLMYLPPEDLLKRPTIGDNDTSHDIINKIRNHYQGFTQQDLYEHGKFTPSTAFSRGELEQKLIDNPLTIVLVPGIFGEFIDNKAFEEYFKVHGQYNTANRLWIAKIPDGKGRTLFTLVLFDTPKMSLESLGSIKKIGRLFSERLNAYSRAEHPKNIALVGYSRGNMTALEMLSGASQTENSPHWFSKVRSVVSLGGVTLGSELGDDAATPGTVTNKQLSALEKLAEDLKPGRENVLRNTAAWGRFGRDMVLSGQELSPMIQMALGARRADLIGLARVNDELARHFGLNRFFSRYDENIKRFKSFVAELKTGTGELSTKSRLEWWKYHTVPTEGIKYYAIGGVMGTKDSPLVKNNRLGYDPQSPDDAFQFKSHDDFNRVSGMCLNDGQVALDKILFPSEILVRHNPEQKSIASGLLGIVGTPHWGLALQSVYPPSKNPFPRETLLKAIAVAVVEGM